MKLEEAIINLNFIREMKSSVLLPDSQDALSLGIEALKLIEWLRKEYTPGTTQPLPGETQD